MYSTRKKILCFGDCNTYGFNPYNNQRYGINQRWTKIVENILNSNSTNTNIKYDVIEEGKNQRTLLIGVTDENNNVIQPAIVDFPEIYSKSHPVSYIIICLGTNDLRKDFNLDTNLIASGIDKLIKLIQRIDLNSNVKANIIIVSPPKLSDNFELITKHNFDKYSTIKSYDLPLLYNEIAKINNCMFLDASEYASVSEIDGVHLASKDHEALGRAIANMIINNEANNKETNNKNKQMK